MTRLASLFVVAALIAPAMAQTPPDPGKPPPKKKVIKKKIVLKPGDPLPPAQP